jgi:lipid-binding SYLF domain-containing protein
MDKRNFLLIGAASAALPLLAACTTTSGGSSDPVERRRAINASVDDALARLYREVNGSRELIASAKGVLVFPSVVSGGFIVGASHGQGALRKGGTTASFYSTTEGSVGLLAGVQSQAVFVLFMTQQALDSFERSSGWTAGVDGSITLISVGANASVTTQTVQQPIVGFVLSNAGLMANLSLNGNRFTRLDL